MRVELGRRVRVLRRTGCSSVVVGLAVRVGVAGCGVGWGSMVGVLGSGLFAMGTLGSVEVRVVDLSGGTLGSWVVAGGWRFQVTRLRGVVWSAGDSGVVDTSSLCSCVWGVQFVLEDIAEGF